MSSQFIVAGLHSVGKAKLKWLNALDVALGSGTGIITFPFFLAPVISTLNYLIRNPRRAFILDCRNVLPEVNLNYFKYFI